MDAPIYVIFLTILRLVLPFGLLLVLGEWIRRRNTKYWL
jgi:hypothetical protein